MSFGGLYISMSGINANKKALDTISHNISNTNNPNYVRQSVIHAESRYSRTQDLRFQTGTGVNVQQIRQIRDEFLDLKLRREMATFGYHYTKAEILGEVEIIFNEITSSGLQKVMDDFWNGWSELYKEPESLTIRGLLHENGVAFTTTVNHVSTQLDNLQSNLNTEMLNKTEEVNEILEKIKDLNKNIKLGEAYGNNISANDFRDSRNALLDRLSELIPITHYENQYGEEIVSLFGRDLVNGDYLNPIDIRLNEQGHGQIHWSDTGDKIDLKGLGELGGYIDARDTAVVEYRDRLNILVANIAQSINEIHKLGTGLDGTTGINFFDLDLKDPAATIKVNSALEDFNKIAASLSGDKGDGEIAKAILNLRDISLFSEYEKYSIDDGEYRYKIDKSTVEAILYELNIDMNEINVEDIKTIENLFDNINKETLNAETIGRIFKIIEEKETTLTTDDFYRDLILNLSLERQESRSIAENQGMLIRQVDERRQEISSVSLDEEMADMLKYQHSYVANSRVINAIDEMIEIIVNRMGIVGR